MYICFTPRNARYRKNAQMISVHRSTYVTAHDSALNPGTPTLSVQRTSYN